MSCPKCKSDKFRPFTTMEKLDLDFCGSCHGIWFDKGELALYSSANFDLPFNELNLKDAKKLSFNCPKCQSALVETPYVKNTNLLIDICSSCHGIWLDAKESPKVRELSARFEPLGKCERAILELSNKGYVVIGSSVIKR